MGNAQLKLIYIIKIIFLCYLKYNTYYLDILY